MKNLLFFSSDYGIGLSALLTDQLISINQEGANVTGVAGEKEQERGLSEIISNKNIRLTRITGLDSHSNFSKLVKTITCIIIDDEIDVLHVQNNWQLAIAGAVKLRLLFKRKIRIIYTLHGFRHNHPIKSKIAQCVIGCALFLTADNIICMTEYLKKKFNLLSYKIKLLPLGVKDSYFLPEFNEPQTEYLRLIFPAQFRQGKNQDMIIRAFIEYVKISNDKRATLLLPGNGPLLSKMKDLVRSLGAERQVKFPGQLSKEEVKQAFLDSNIAIVASNSETFGQSIVEPFVLGRCVISTPVGIAPEIIQEGLNGYIFKTEKELTDILLSLSKNYNTLRDIGWTNYASRNRFSWSSITKAYLAEFLSD